MSSFLSKYYNGYFEKNFKKIKNLDYDEDFYKLVPGSNYSLAIASLEKLASSNSKPAVLEIGVGTGAMLHWFRHKGIEPRGIEISEFVVDHLRKKDFDVRLVDVNEQPIPFEDGEFDVVLSLDVIEHIIDPFSFMAEISRVLAPGGVAILSTANSRTVKRALQLFVLGRFPWTSDADQWTSEEDDGWDRGHLHYFTTRDVSSLGERFGLKTTRCDGTFSSGNSVMDRLKRLFLSLLPSGVKREFFSGGFVAVMKKEDHQPG